jgi:hypothetical protein
MLSTPAKLKTALAASDVSLDHYSLVAMRLTHYCPET